jgi:hypothetical protein
LQKSLAVHKGTWRLRLDEVSGSNARLWLLSHAVTTTLIPVLPYLFKAGDKVTERTGKQVAGEAWEWSKELWAKLRPKVEAKPAALEAAQGVAKTPDDPDAQAALRVQFRKLLTEDEALAGQVSQLIPSKLKKQSQRDLISS